LPKSVLLLLTLAALLLGACAPRANQQVAHLSETGSLASPSPHAAASKQPTVGEVPTATGQPTATSTRQSTATSATQATVAPTARPSPTPSATPVPTAIGQEVRLTIVYNNNPYDPRLISQWGFACLVQYGDHTLLFDTGGDGPTLLHNMETLGIDPTSIEAVILSHEHGDHVGGLGGLLDVHSDLTVYAPTCFAGQIQAQVQAAGAQLVEVEEPMELLPGVFSTGQVSGTVTEQALALESPQGLVVLAGCAHPGIVQMVSAAKNAASSMPYLVLGGFHLRNHSTRAIEQTIAELQRLGVQKAAPSHCSGDNARDLFAAGYGDDYMAVGVGWSITINQ